MELSKGLGLLALEAARAGADTALVCLASGASPLLARGLIATNAESPAQSGEGLVQVESEMACQEMVRMELQHPAGDSESRQRRLHTGHGARSTVQRNDAGEIRKAVGHSCGEGGGDLLILELTGDKYLVCKNV